MWADAKRDGRPAEYTWRPQRKFRNSIPCSTPQSMADARCWPECHTVTLPIYENARLGRKVNFARGKIPSGAKAANNVDIVYQPKRLPKIVQSLVGLR